MQTSTTEWTEQLEAAAVAFRRANRPAWKNAHADRLAREREARETSREYRKAQKQQKHCSECSELRPTEAFELLPSGGLRGTCRDCRTAKKAAAKRAARAARRETPEYQAELERKALERDQQKQAREAAKAHEREELQAAKEAEWAALRAAEEERRRKRLQRKRGVRKRALSPERQREVAARIPQLTALLMGTSPRERIIDQQSWEATATELQSLWLQSGDKQCISCKAVVPPTAIRPPGPANFYPGKCNSCSAAEYAERHMQVFGRPFEGPPLIPMRDGSFISIGELARRHRERQSERRRAG